MISVCRSSTLNQLCVCKFHLSIEEDILRLIDEVDLKKELKEVGEAIVDTDKFPQYIREKSASAVSRFLVCIFFHLFKLLHSSFMIMNVHVSNISQFANNGPTGLFAKNVNTHRKKRNRR